MLACINGQTELAGQNKCVYDAYNVPVAAGVPSVSATVPGPINTTPAGSSPTAGSTSTTGGSGANSKHASIVAAGIAALVASFASFLL